MAKKQEIYYPYVQVDKVSTRLLDFLFIAHIDFEVMKRVVVIDSKYNRKFKQQIKENYSNIYKTMLLSSELAAHYKVYNELVKEAMKDELLSDASFEALTENIEHVLEQRLALCDTDDARLREIARATNTCRLYKKGRFANDYVPRIMALLPAELPGFIELFEEGLTAEEQMARAEHYMRANEPVEQAPPAEQALKVADFKEQMQQLLNQLQEDAVDQQQQEHINRLEGDVKWATKQLKKKDEQYSRLQKQLADVKKDYEQLQQETVATKRTAKIQEQALSDLKKREQEAQIELARHKKQQGMHAVTLKQAVETARRDSTAALERKLKEQETSYSEQLANQLKGTETLRKRLEREREEHLQEVTELERLRQFQQAYLQLAAEHEQLKKDKQTLTAELQQLKKQTPPVVAVSPAPQPVPDEIIDIDEDLFNLVTNHPEPESEGAQTGEIYVIKDEDEIDFDALLSNKPI